MALKSKRVNRSLSGNIAVFTGLFLAGLFFLVPLIFLVVNAFKPLNELFIYPPKLYVIKPTLDNFVMMFQLMRSTRLPFERYLLNSVFVTGIGTFIYVLLAAFTAYPLAKHKFGGKTLYVNIIIWTMLFKPEILFTPTYIVMNKLSLMNTYFTTLFPLFASSMGVFILRQFMLATVPDSLLEAARIDGAGEYSTFFNIVLPMVKPAWLTVTLFTFQSLWNTTGEHYIYDEQLKFVNVALQQLAAGGISRAGIASAVVLVLIIPTIIMFVVCQSSIMDTMSHSGIK